MIAAVVIGVVILGCVGAWYGGKVARALVAAGPEPDAYAVAPPAPSPVLCGTCRHNCTANDDYPLTTEGRGCALHPLGTPDPATGKYTRYKRIENLNSELDCELWEKK